MAESSTQDLLNITLSVKSLTEAFAIACSTKSDAKEPMPILDVPYARHLLKEYMKKVGIIPKQEKGKFTNVVKKEKGGEVKV